VREEVGLADDCSILWVDVQVVILILLFTIQYFEPNELALGQRLLKLESSVFFGLDLSHVFLSFDRSLDLMVDLAAQNLKVSLRQ